MKQENSAYRLINNYIVEVINEREIECIENACNSPFENVRNHFKKSLALLSNRENPDYENSIKESISAVEAWAKIIMNSPSASLGDLIKKVSIHKSLKKGIDAFYGFASDKSGIRHSSKDEDIDHGIIEFSDALFSLILCSSIINYVSQKKPELQVSSL